MRQKFPDMRDQNNNFQNTIWVPNQVLPSFSAVETFWNVSLSPWNFALGLMAARGSSCDKKEISHSRRQRGGGMADFGSSLLQLNHFLFPVNFSIHCLILRWSKVFLGGSREHAISLSMGHNRPEKLHCPSEWRLNKIWFWNQNSHNLRNTLMFEICPMSILTLRLEISRAKMFGCFWSGVAWLCGQGGRQDPGPGQLYRFPTTTQHHTITLPHHDRQEGSRHAG